MMAALLHMFRRQFNWTSWKALYKFSQSRVRLKHDGFVPIASILQDHPIDSDVKIKGWVKSIRKQKENTFLHVGDGVTSEQIQVVVPSSTFLEHGAGCTFNSAVEVSGRLVKSPSAKQPFEIQGTTVTVVGKLDLDGFPFAPRRLYPFDYLRQYPHLRPKTDIFAALLRLTSLVAGSLQSTLASNDYVQVFTPVISSNDCEGSGEVFTVRPASDQLCRNMRGQEGGNMDEAYFNKKVYLTVSGQLHLEAIAGGLPKVFTLGPTFRAENSRSRRHLAEFRMLEAELAFCNNLQPLLSIMEELIKKAAIDILERGAKDLAVVSNFHKENIEESLAVIVKSPFVTLTYKEGMEILIKNAKTFKSSPRNGHDLGAEHELFLVEHTGGRPTFLVDWPANIKPFYMRTKEEDSNLASCVDLLVPGVGELCGGSLRENRHNVLKDRLEQLKLDQALNWYLDLRKFGGSPTGGFGMGLERLVAYLLKISNVKDIVPFPRTPHQCPM